MFENIIDISSIFIIQNILIYLLMVNLIVFLAMWIDKIKAKNGKWRISEATLFVLSILGGSIGRDNRNVYI